MYASHLLNRLTTTAMDVRLRWRLGQVELFVIMVRLVYLVVWPMLLSRKTC